VNPSLTIAAMTERTMSRIPARAKAAPAEPLPYPHLISIDGRPVATINGGGRVVAAPQSGKRPTLAPLLLLLAGLLPLLLLLFGLKKK